MGRDDAVHIFKPVRLLATRGRVRAMCSEELLSSSHIDEDDITLFAVI